MNNSKKRKRNKENENSNKVVKKRKRNTINIDINGICVEPYCNNTIFYKKTRLCEKHGRKLKLKKISLEHGGHCIIYLCTNKIRRRLLCAKHYQSFMSIIKKNQCKDIIEFVHLYNENRNIF